MRRTVYLVGSFHFYIPSLPIATRRKKRSQFLEVLLILIVKARRLRTIYINNCDSLTIHQPPSQQNAREYQNQNRNKLTSPPAKIGTTISLLLLASQAMCPGNSSTSGTTTVSRFSAAAPHTPRPNRISWHAGRPWKGPSQRVFVTGVAPVSVEDALEDGNLSRRM